jgi:hypothetical protein
VSSARLSVIEQTASKLSFHETTDLPSLDRLSRNDSQRAAVIELSPLDHPVQTRNIERIVKSDDVTLLLFHERIYNTEEVTDDFSNMAKTAETITRMASNHW